MEIEIGLTFLLLLLLCLLATVEMAFGQVSDVGLHRLSGESEEQSEGRPKVFLEQVLENGRGLVFALSATINVACSRRRPHHFDFVSLLF